MLEVQNLTVSYFQRPILQNLSACFRKGTLTSVIGANGAGKSTLFKALLGIIPITEGRILVDREDLALLKRRLVAQRIAYLAQGKGLPDMTVGQMVLHGRFPHLSYPRRYSARDREIATLAMKKMGITHLSEEPMAALSGGMRQSACLAMVLAQETDYILLDEPTSYLDIARQIELMRLLRQLADDGKGIVCVSHDLPLAFGFSDEIALLDGGRIVGHSSPEELCKSPELERVFGVTLERNVTTGNYSYRF